MSTTLRTLFSTLKEYFPFFRRTYRIPSPDLTDRTVAGPRKEFFDNFKAVKRQPFSIFRHLHRKPIIRRLLCKAAPCRRLAFNVRKIWLYVENRSSVTEIGSRNFKHGAVFFVLNNMFKLYKRKPYGIGPKGRTSGKNAHSLISPSLGGRTVSEGSFSCFCPVKLPQSQI